MVLDHQEASHELDDSVRVRVREALLKRHHHQNERKKNLIPMVRSITEGTRKPSEPQGICGFFHTASHPIEYESVKTLMYLDKTRVKRGKSKQGFAGEIQTNDITLSKNKINWHCNWKTFR